MLNLDGSIATPGTRVINVTLDDGTVIVARGVVAPGPDLTAATIDFLAGVVTDIRALGHRFTQVGVTYQQALAN